MGDNLVFYLPIFTCILISLIFTIDSNFI